MNYKAALTIILVLALGLELFQINGHNPVKETNIQLNSKAFFGNALYVNDSITQNDTLIVVAVGDIMLGTNFPSVKFLPPYGTDLLYNAGENLKNADFTFGNLEGVLLDSGGKAKTCKDSNLCYLFRMNTLSATYLKNWGFDVLSVANNHSGDFGDEGRQSSIKTLQSYGMDGAGFLSKPISIVTTNGIKYGVAAFSPNFGTENINDSARVFKLVDSLRPHCDILLVSFHGGAEGRGKQHITRNYEYFYSENRGNVYKFARWAIDAGADMVIGHGPHVPRAVDIYKGKFIAYSLGNFCTYARFNLKGENGYAPLLRIYVDKNGRFLKAEIKSYIQYGEGSPVADPQNRAYLKIKELTLQDIPENKLRFIKGNTILPPAKK